MHRLYYVQETFAPATEHGGGAGAVAGRSMRYLEWTHAPEHGATRYMTDNICLLRAGNQPVRGEYEQHICGLFRAIPG